MIPFNKPYLSGNELDYIGQSILTGKISGDGIFTKKVHEYFESKYNFNKCLVTTSCTDALEMAAILLEIKEGDEVIIPSYTFVSTANAFVLRGAKVIFVDSREDHPGLNEDKVEELITKKTKAIIVVHYAGVACNMDKIMYLANKYNLFVVEDAAQAINSYYVNNFNQKIALGSIGHLATFSFHETKNIISGEGGMLVINDQRFAARAEIIREKGTNRSSFFRGEVDKYSWVDIGSSFLPSDMISAFLFGQLENLEKIQSRRIEIWNRYHQNLSNSTNFKTPCIPDYAIHNAHMFYICLESLEVRNRLILELKNKGVNAVFHYLSLNKSSFYNDNKSNVCSDYFSDSLLRLPFYYELSDSDVDFISDLIIKFL